MKPQLPRCPNAVGKWRCVLKPGHAGAHQGPVFWGAVKIDEEAMRMVAKAGKEEFLCHCSTEKLMRSGCACGGK